jgi:hypothetical protein
LFWLDAQEEHVFDGVLTKHIHVKGDFVPKKSHAIIFPRVKKGAQGLDPN